MIRFLMDHVSSWRADCPQEKIALIFLTVRTSAGVGSLVFHPRTSPQHRISIHCADVAAPCRRSGRSKRSPDMGQPRRVRYGYINEAVRIAISVIGATDHHFAGSQFVQPIPEPSWVYLFLRILQPDQSSRLTAF